VAPLYQFAVASNVSVIRNNTKNSQEFYPYSAFSIAVRSKRNNERVTDLALYGTMLVKLMYLRKQSGLLLTLCFIPRVGQSGI